MSLAAAGRHWERRPWIIIFCNHRIREKTLEHVFVSECLEGAVEAPDLRRRDTAIGGRCRPGYDIVVRAPWTWSATSS